jgi:hypothetical protein
MSRFLRAQVATLLAIVISTLAIQQSRAQGTAPPAFRSDYPFSFSTSCTNSASAVCRRKPRAQSDVRFATDTLRITGDTSAVRIEAHQSTIADVLFGLGTAFNVRYRTSIVLDEARNGTYTGTLRRVISRVLDGYDYVVKYENSQLDITIVAKSGGQAVAAPPVAGIRRGRCACAVEWPPSSATRLSHQNRCPCK